MGHYQKIEQVIINLLINALQALPDRQAGVFLCTSLQESPRSVVIKIRDQGTGIPEEIRGRILDPFFTTKHKAGGTGLGLSICYAIINDHKGTIDFASEIGAGTTVTVTLPVL
jgi:signal transduction histidine kinase